MKSADTDYGECQRESKVSAIIKQVDPSFSKTPLPYRFVLWYIWPPFELEKNFVHEQVLHK